MNTLLSYFWLGMYLLCIGLGTLEGATGIAKAALVLITLVFFLPAGLLVYNGLTSKDKKLLTRIRILSIVSLALTLVGLITFFVVSFLYAAGTLAPLAVNISFYVLLVVSSPLFCGQYLYLGPFLWAALLFATFIKLPPKQK